MPYLGVCCRLATVWRRPVDVQRRGEFDLPANHFPDEFTGVEAKHQPSLEKLYALGPVGEQAGKDSRFGQLDVGIDPGGVNLLLPTDTVLDTSNGCTGGGQSQVEAALSLLGRAGACLSDERLHRSIAQSAEATNPRPFPVPQAFWTNTPIDCPLSYWIAVDRSSLHWTILPLKTSNGAHFWTPLDRLGFLLS